MSEAIRQAVKDRMGQGQFFNAYEGRGGYLVGIGPVTNFMCLISCGSPVVADMIVDALRTKFGQPPLETPLASSVPEIGGQRDC